MQRLRGRPLVRPIADGMIYTAAAVGRQCLSRKIPGPCTLASGSDEPWLRSGGARGTDCTPEQILFEGACVIRGPSDAYHHFLLVRDEPCVLVRL